MVVTNLKLWDLAPVDKEAAVRLGRECRIPVLLAALLRVRGADSPEAVSRFFQPQELSDPFLMKDMDRAVKRIRQAVDEGERIAVYGDYDADGVTASAMLYTYLSEKGAQVSCYIPQRDSEGYGMNLAAMDTLSREGVDLIITVDNGVSAVEEIAYARSLGMDVVVTDHHQPHETLPDVPLVDAHREDDESPFPELCGAGVVLKLLMALEGDREAVCRRFGDLAALGTVGDAVELTGENRLIVQKGLRVMEDRGRPGLAALLDEGERAVSSTQLAFSVIPCINATGRMGSPHRAVRLLTCTDAASARLLAEELREENRRRKETEAQVVDAIYRALKREPSLSLDRIVVVAGENWHHGVVGIAAAKISDATGKPCIIFSIQNGEARGSGRSIEGFDLFQAVTSCQDLLLRYGGHPMAAGLSLLPENLELFRQRINEYAREFSGEMPFPTLRLDCTLRPQALTLSTCQSLAPLEPVGTGNPQPVFAILGVTLREVCSLGSSGLHTKLVCRGETGDFTCLRFGSAPEDFPYPPGSLIDLAVNVQINRYNGRESVEVILRDVRLSGLDRLELLRDLRVYERFRRGEPLTEEEARRLSPSREVLGAVYRLLPQVMGPRLGVEALVFRFRERGLNLGSLLFGLDVLAERELIRYRLAGCMLQAQKLPRDSKDKADLSLSPLYRKLKEQSAGEREAKEKED